MVKTSLRKAICTYLQHKELNKTIEAGSKWLTCNFVLKLILISCGMVLVTTTHSNLELLMFVIAVPDRIPCVQMA